MKLFYTDLHLRLHREPRELFGLYLPKASEEDNHDFPNLSPGTKYIISDGIGIWTTEECPLNFKEFQKLNGEKLAIVKYALNRHNLKRLMVDVVPETHPLQRNWQRFWLNFTLRCEEKIRVLTSPSRPGEILVNDAYYQIFEVHLEQSRCDEQKFYRVAFVEYEKPAPLRTIPALVLLRFKEDLARKTEIDPLPEYHIEGYISLILPAGGE